MRLTLRRRDTDQLAPGITATARVGARTRILATRLRPGEIAVIDHVDLDRGAAEALVAARPAAVVNAARSISGRFPALGAQVVVRAGIPLLDAVGPDVFAVVADGATVRVDGAVLHADGRAIEGLLHTGETVAAAMAAARAGLDVQLEAFTAAASELLRREHALLLDGSGTPPVLTPLAGRAVVVVAEGPTAAAELASLRGFVQDRRPVLVGVETGADVCLAAGLRPDLVVGAFDRVSDQALQCGAELVLHTRHAVRPSGEQRTERLVVAAVTFPYAGRSEDAALLLAAQGGADVVVLAGGAQGLLACLDAGRTAMASTFLARLQVGGRLVPARSAAALHRRATSARLLALMLAAQLLALGAAVAGAGGPVDAWRDVRDAGRQVVEQLVGQVAERAGAGLPIGTPR